jgi:hypothetical protein
MTNTDIANLITELSTSDLFPQFATPTKMMLAIYETNVRTPESISVAEKFYQLAKDLAVDDVADALAKILNGVDPRQGQSLWVAMLSVSKIAKLVEKLRYGNSLPLRGFMNSLRRSFGMQLKYDTLKMTAAEYDAQQTFRGPKNWTKQDHDKHDAELVAKFPLD